MIAALLAALAAGGIPGIAAAGGGVLSLAGGALSLFLSKYRVYFIVAGLIGLVAASVGVTLWIVDLQEKAEALEVLKTEVATLTADMGCKAKEAPLVCFQRQRSEIAEAHSKLLLAQAETAARVRGELQASIDKLQADLSTTDAEIDADTDADDGPLPKTLTNAWARERAHRGAK
jgi:Tfp pilus assembly protein PilO